MNDETMEPKEVAVKTQDFSGVKEVPEVVETRKPNRHERRKRAKLARMLAMKEKLEATQRNK